MECASRNLSKDLTSGSVLSTLIRFSLPFLLSSFLQTFYGLADLFITGQFYGPSSISAVSIGSQLMHMITVIIIGLAMGTTVCISRAVGIKNKKEVLQNIGNSLSFFFFFSIVSTLVLIFSIDFILKLLSTPTEAFNETRTYCFICFVGVPFITSYNILSSIYRGLGDSKSPMIFIAFAGVLNIGLDYLFIGYFHFGAGGAALATVISQGCSVIFALFLLKKTGKDFFKADASGGFSFRKSFRFRKETILPILKIGIPISFQDGFIQISFLVITSIANSRGVYVAAAVGIVEKIICFLFLVPSAMLSSVSAIGAQNAGAQKHQRSFKTLGYAVVICVIFGLIVTILGNLFPNGILSLFSTDMQVIEFGTQYFRSYVTDCIIAGIHFCISGFFCAYGKSMYSFIHNTLSICIFRIPLSYIAAKLYPDTLFPMGMAAPIGSLFSAIFCIILLSNFKKKYNNGEKLG